jgi:hypothetical protein
MAAATAVARSVPGAVVRAVFTVLRIFERSARLRARRRSL